MRLAFSHGWRSLGIPSSELRLEFALPTGQTFRWSETARDVYTGVVRYSVLQLKQTENDVCYRRLNRPVVSGSQSDEDLLREYFNLGVCRMEDLSMEWSRKDTRFKQIAPFLKGARVIRQDPLECLFEFICSSNNHIGRIQSMVETLCEQYGSLLWPESTQPPLEDCNEEAIVDLPEKRSFYSFPTLQQMKDIKEDDLRNKGFGYRAKFISSCVEELLKKDNGEQWLRSLRDVSYEEACNQLCKLPGVGPKVAACVCLFALDKHQAIPVDTHVHQLAMKYYQLELKNKSLTKKMMKNIEQTFQDVFGDYAGWAHNVLFIAELSSHQTYLPEELRQSKRSKTVTGIKRKRSVQKQ